MAWDNYVCTYHLTPRGWKMGDDAPADAVWTVGERTYQRSGFSKEEITWSAGPPIGTRERVAALLRKHPHPPRYAAHVAKTLKDLLAGSSK